jgi:hypothetical protein
LTIHEPVLKAGCVPVTFLHDLDVAAAQYSEAVDGGRLVYPACKRAVTDPESDARSIWVHTRLEAARYLTMIPAREDEWLIAPSRQPEIVGAFLRRQPHDQFIIDFTGSATDDIVIAVQAGLNWLNHCSELVKVERSRSRGTFYTFRKVIRLSQTWWNMEGAQSRCAELLKSGKQPPLLLYLAWQEYTRLSKEIALAARFGPAINAAIRGIRAESSDLQGGTHALTDTLARFQAASDPEEMQAQS